MTLTNYWWLLIWLFTGGLALAAYFPKHREMVCGKVEIRWGVVPAVLMAVPYIVWAGYRSDAFGDTGAYRGAFKDAPSSFSEMSAYLDTIMKDKGFYGLVAALKSLFHVSDIGCFMLLAGFQLLVSFFLFIASTDYMSWAQNGVRQFLAVTIALLATPFMLKKKYIPAILLIILASTMHQSALLMIPLMTIAQGKPWNRRTILFLLLALVAILYVGKFTSLLDNAMKETQYANMVNDWTSWGDDGTNPLRVLIYSIPAILSFIGLKYIQEANDPVINLCTNMSIISSGIYLVSMVTSGIFIGRLPIYASLYSYILLPWEIEHIFMRKSARLVMVVAVVAYCGFFYYQMRFTWGLV